jgi:preprotein translocase subunit SecE
MGWFEQASTFLSEVRLEVRKMVWPTRKETTATTAAVILAVFIVAVYLGFLDLGLSKIVEFLID